MTESVFEKRFELNQHLISALDMQKIAKPTEIQERVIPAILKGFNLIGRSQTGTGKTLAFLLPIIQKIDRENEQVQAVITAPTRELANQVYQEAIKLTEAYPEESKPRIKTVVGGTDRKRMVETLKANPHIIIGTPGRIKDLVETGAINVYTASILVVDEADQTLDMGFIEEVDFVASRMAKELQMMVFSATIPENLQPFLRKYMDNPKFVEVQPENVTAVEITHVAIPLKFRDKLQLLADVAKLYNPYLAIIFTNTKKTADEVAGALLSKGLNVDLLHGGLQARERRNVMKRVQKAECQFLVATDLAARGIDIEGVSHIINFELPKDLDYYIHRSGRTGRAGMDGISATIYEPSDEQALAKLQSRGIQFQYKDLKNGELTSIDDRIKRKARKPAPIQKQGKFIAKPKKVKPGYKKKFQAELDKQEQRRRRKNK
jgi:ATP-dependent RNA helicase CshB